MAAVVDMDMDMGEWIRESRRRRGGKGGGTGVRNV